MTCDVLRSFAILFLLGWILGSPVAAQSPQLQEAKRLREQVDQQFAKGNIREAAALAKKIVDIRRAAQGENHPDTATAWNDLGLTHEELGNHAEARTCHEQALRIRKAVLGDKHVDTATSLANLGGVLQTQGKYTEAMPFYEQSLEVFLKAKGEENEYTATALHNLGSLAHEVGEYPSARVFYERSLKIRKKVLGLVHIDTVNSLNNLGGLLQDQGDLAGAKVHLEQALGASVKLFGQEHPTTAQVAHVYAHLLEQQGDLVTAKSFYKLALDIRKKKLGAEHPDTATTLNNLGGLLLKQGDIAAAGESLGEAFKIRAKVYGEEHPVTAGAISNLGGMLLNIGQAEKARQFLEIALSLRKKMLGAEHPDTAKSWLDLAQMEAKLGDLDAARKALDESRRSARKHIAVTLPGLSDKEQLTFLREKEEAWFSGALSLITLKPGDQALTDTSAGWLLNGKGLAQEAIAQRNLLLRDVKKPELTADIEKLESLRRELGNLALRAPKAGEEKQRQELLDRLSAQEAELTRALARKTARPERPADPWVELATVRKAIPADGVLIEFARFPVFDFNAIGAQKQWGPNRYAAWLIPPAGRGEVTFVDLGAADKIDEALTKAKETIGSPGKPEGRQIDPAEHEKAAREVLARVRDLVWKPLADKLPAETKRIVLSPDGDLWLLPWAALPTGKDDEKLLLEDYILSLVISGRELTRERVKVATSTPIILADPDYDLTADSTRQSVKAVFPALDLNDNAVRGLQSQSRFTNVQRLPNTAVEAEVVSPRMQEIAQTEPKKFLGQFALEAVVKRVIRPKMLLISTHGFFLPDQEVVDQRPAVAGAVAADTRSAALASADGTPVENPLLRCGLLFAGCNSRQAIGGDEGVLTGMEVVSLDLRGTELVVLSACETGIGKVHNGQGVAGLRQAFQLAGAETVVATLWNVPDKDSAIIMNDFFQNLAAGKPRAEALRDAQLKRIERRRDREGAAPPFYWAAWTLTSE